MMKKTPLEKRVKRRVTARTHRFFASCSPGLKRLCHREIVELAQNAKVAELTQEDASATDNAHGGFSPLTPEDITVIPGGVEFTATVQDCYGANLYLRSCSRILMRIAKFKAENFRTLEKRVGEVEWELYLKPSIPVKYEVSTSSSRLYHKDAIAQRVEQSVAAYFHNLDIDALQRDGGEKRYGMQTIMIRGEDDFFEISIDSSGELLHKRGLKEYVGAAPIRETLAFAILSAMEYSPDLPLIDGMCGSGTFALEAAMISENIPAGFFRKFAFEEWPCFSQRQWNHMKKRAGSAITSPYKRAIISHKKADIIYSDKSEIPYGAIEGGAAQKPLIFAVDQDSGILELLNRTVEEFHLSSSIKIIKSDFFDLSPEELVDSRGDLADYRGKTADKKGFVVLNPPYGKRIGEKRDSDQLFDNIGKKLKSDFRGWCAAVIVPDKKILEHLPGKKSLIPIFHGGLEIHAAIILL